MESRRVYYSSRRGGGRVQEGKTVAHSNRWCTHFWVLKGAKHGRVCGSDRSEDEQLVIESSVHKRLYPYLDALSLDGPAMFPFLSLSLSSALGRLVGVKDPK